MKYNRTALLFIIFTVFYSCHKKTIDFYVSPIGNDSNKGTKTTPFKTIEKALIYTQNLNKNKNINILLLEGEYHLTSALKITPKLNNISIIGEGTDKVTVRGSKIIESNWEHFAENILVTTIDESLDFNQLFINDQKQIKIKLTNALRYFHI